MSTSTGLSAGTIHLYHNRPYGMFVTATAGVACWPLALPGSRIRLPAYIDDSHSLSLAI